MPDTKHLSLDRFFSISKTQIFAPGKQRHVVDGLRTVAWFNCLRFCSGVAGLALMKTGRGGCELDREVGDKKLLGYRLGRHTPSSEVVGRAGVLCPVSRFVLEHVIWSVLRTDRPVPRAKQLWISRLNPEIQRVIYRRSGANSLASTPWWRLDYISEPMLVRRAGLDSLAGFLALMRIAINEGDVDYAERLSPYVCRSLLILAPGHSNLGILLPMFELIEREFLDKLPGGWAFRNRGAGFISDERCLSLVASVIEHEQGVPLSPEKRFKLRVNLVAQTYGAPYLEDFDWKPFTTDNTGRHGLD